MFSRNLCIILCLTFLACKTTHQPETSAISSLSGGHTMSIGNGYPLFALAPAIWQINEIPVCWQSSASQWTKEKGWVQEAIASTWSANSVIRFVGWQTCAAQSSGIRIDIEDTAKAPHTKGLGTQLNGKAPGMVLNFSFNNWGTPCLTKVEFCIRAIAVHEFGHALSFAHEQDRDDQKGCDEKQTDSGGDFKVTSYDLKSVMNYCNPNWNGDGNLSDLDKEGLRLLYGSDRSLVAYHQGCSGPGQARTPDCAAAVHRYCALTGRGSAGYPQELGATEMGVLCLNASWTGIVPYSSLGACTGPDISQRPECFAAAHRYCDSIGVGGIGWIQEVSQTDVALYCVPTANYQLVKMNELRSLHGSCTNPDQAQDPACLSATHQYCTSRGLGDGGTILELGADEVGLACVKGANYSLAQFTR